jgi:isoamylase
VRDRQKRNFLATLLCSQGVPMLLGGDEIGRSQQGNNNAYCQDNEISWFDWELDARARDLLEFTARVIRLRKDHPALRRRRFFQGIEIRGSDIPDITWLTPDGREMSDEEWSADWARALAFRLGGDALGDTDPEGRLVVDDDFLVLLNADGRPVMFTLPGDPARDWHVRLDTAHRCGDGHGRSLPGGAEVELVDRAMMVLCRVSRSKE